MNNGQYEQNYYYPPQPPQQPQRERKIVSVLKAAGYFFLYFGITNLVGVIIALGVFFTDYFKRFPEMMEAQTYEDTMKIATEMTNQLQVFLYDNALLMTFIANTIAVAVLALIFFLRRKREPNATENKFIFKNPGALNVVVILICGFLLNFAVNPILDLVFRLLPNSVLESYSSYSNVYSVGGIAVFILGGIISAPVCEEFVLRGAMTSRLGRAMNPHLAIFLTSLCFGVIHGHPIQMLYTFALGMLLGYVFRKHGLFGSIALHFGFNLGSLPAMVLEMINPAITESQAFILTYTALSYVSIPVSVLLTVFIFRKKKSSSYAEGGNING